MSGANQILKRRLPNDTGNGYCPISYRELDSADDPLITYWDKEIQPHIKKDRPNAPDADWNWRAIHNNVSLVGSPIPLVTLSKAPKIYALTYMTSNGEVPAGLMALLEEERWPFDHSMNAVYCFYISSAMPKVLRKCINEEAPKAVGRTLLHYAVYRSHIRKAGGRLWLHADPKGGADLKNWYKNCKMKVLPKSNSGKMITVPGLIRTNDGRYMYYD